MFDIFNWAAAGANHRSQFDFDGWDCWGWGVQRHVDKHPARFASVVGERSKLNVKTNENKTWGLAVVLLPQTE